jgi:hypothetical protein
MERYTYVNSEKVRISKMAITAYFKAFVETGENYEQSNSGYKLNWLRFRQSTS